MNSEFELYCEKVKGNIKYLIENSLYNDAEKLINEYEQVVKHDVEVYSMRAIINMLKDKYSIAEEILLKGFNLYPDNFDLLYNLGYIYEQKQLQNEAIKFYNLALLCCQDSDIGIIIKDKISSINEKLKAQLNLQQDTRFNINKVLFIQSVPDIRTYKISRVLHNAGIQVDIMYSGYHPEEIYRNLPMHYKKIYKIEDIKETINFINDSDYDVLFSCNEPDFISALLTISNKPLIHDCHDMMSLRGNISNEQVVAEYIANCKADGNVYVTEFIRNIAESKFILGNKPILVLDNYALKEQLPRTFLSKLSDIDGEIHCVYEGGLTNIEGHHRNIESIFLKLTEANIHVHYYVPFDNNYYKQMQNKSSYLHYEGVKGPNELIQEMTKYDIGLTILNVTERNRAFLDTTFPNKTWEYLSAGLPVLFSDLLVFEKFLNKYDVGEILELRGNIYKQVQRVKNIKIDKEFIVERGLLMDNFTTEIINFLSCVKDNKHLDKIT